LAGHVSIVTAIYGPIVAAVTIVTAKSATRGGQTPPRKIFASPGKMSWTKFNSMDTVQKI